MPLPEDLTFGVFDNACLERFVSQPILLLCQVQIRANKIFASLIDGGSQICPDNSKTRYLTRSTTTGMNCCVNGGVPKPADVVKLIDYSARRMTGKSEIVFVILKMIILRNAPDSFQGLEATLPYPYETAPSQLLQIQNYDGNLELQDDHVDNSGLSNFRNNSENLGDSLKNNKNHHEEAQRPQSEQVEPSRFNNTKTNYLSPTVSIDSSKKFQYPPMAYSPHNQQAFLNSEEQSVVNPVPSFQNLASKNSTNYDNPSSNFDSSASPDYCKFEVLPPNHYPPLHQIKSQLVTKDSHAPPKVSALNQYKTFSLDCRPMEMTYQSGTPFSKQPLCMPKKEHHLPTHVDNNQTSEFSTKQQCAPQFDQQILSPDSMQQQSDCNHVNSTSSYYQSTTASNQQPQRPLNLGNHSYNATSNQQPQNHYQNRSPQYSETQETYGDPNQHFENNVSHNYGDSSMMEQNFHSDKQQQSISFDLDEEAVEPYAHQSVLNPSIRSSHSYNYNNEPIVNDREPLQANTAYNYSNIQTKSKYIISNLDNLQKFKGNQTYQSPEPENPQSKIHEKPTSMTFHHNQSISNNQQECNVPQSTKNNTEASTSESMQHPCTNRIYNDSNNNVEKQQKDRIQSKADSSFQASRHLAVGMRAEPYTPTKSNGPISRRNEGQILEIANLNPFLGRWLVKGRFINKKEPRLYSNNRGEGKLLTIDLVDKSAAIRCTFFNRAADKFFDVIRDNEVYLVSKGILRPTNRKFNNLPHNYEIQFNEDALIQWVSEDDLTIPQKEVPPLSPIASLANIAKGTMVSLYAVCINVSEITDVLTRSSGQSRSKRDLTLVDSSGTSIEITLWGNKPSDQLLNIVNKDMNAPVLYIENARVDEFNGKRLSSNPLTEMRVNDKSVAAERLKNWYISEGANLNFNFLSNMAWSLEVKANDHITIMEVTKRIAENVSESEFEEKGYWFYCTAILTNIDRSRPIYWIACPLCNKKVTPSSSASTSIETAKNMETENEASNDLSATYCANCSKHIDKPVRRYLLRLEITDHTGSLKCTAIANKGTQIMGNIEADKLVDIQYKSFTDEDIYQSYDDYFTQRLYKSYIFKIQAKSETYRDETKINYRVFNVESLNAIIPSDPPTGPNGIETCRSSMIKECRRILNLARSYLDEK